MELKVSEAPDLSRAAGGGAVVGVGGGRGGGQEERKEGVLGLVSSEPHLPD